MRSFNTSTKSAEAEESSVHVRYSKTTKKYNEHGDKTRHIQGVHTATLPGLSHSSILLIKDHIDCILHAFFPILKC